MSLIKLARDGDYAGVVRLLTDRPSIANETDELGHSALFCAVIGRHVEICRVLLEAGLDPNETSAEFGFTVLHKACFSGSLEICTMLVERGADVSCKDPKDSDALYNAITGAGDLTMCQYLISKGASRDGALHLACFHGKQDVVAWLLDAVAIGK
jgi:ankyrin repeat protein